MQNINLRVYFLFLFISCAFMVFAMAGEIESVIRDPNSFLTQEQQSRLSNQIDEIKLINIHIYIDTDDVDILDSGFTFSDSKKTLADSMDDRSVYLTLFANSGHFSIYFTDTDSMKEIFSKDVRDEIVQSMMPFFAEFNYYGAFEKGVDAIQDILERSPTSRKLLEDAATNGSIMSSFERYFDATWRYAKTLPLFSSFGW